MNSPTTIEAFARNGLDGNFAMLARERTFLRLMAVGSAVGTFMGDPLLGSVPEHVMLPALVAISLVSA